MTMRPPRAGTAWLLYFSVLFAALVCAIGHGQMAGLQLSGMDTSFCALDAEPSAGSRADTGAAVVMSLLGGGCVIASSFGAILLAAFFGLFGLLGGDGLNPLPDLLLAIQRRHRWPSLNPRASPHP
jgi:hypothetical protein